MAVSVLEVEGLSYSYPSGVEALREVSFAIPEGDTVGLIGPNGAGKSTLMLHLNGLLTGEGDVRVDGEAISRKTVDRIRAAVGLVFQSPDDQLFMPTVLEDVAFGPLNRGVAPEEARERSVRALEQVGMAGHEDRPPYHLSLGQKKRVALATVLVLECRLMVLDEPTAGLDPRGRREFIGVLARLGCTKIMATHDMNLAAELCNRVLLLDGGQVVADEPAKVLLADAELLEAHGLEKPTIPL